MSHESLARSIKGFEARAFGLAMEDEARLWFLSHVGGRCLAFRDRWKGGEIDLVFEVPGPGGAIELVFVEVKARSSAGYSGALGSLGYRKLDRISRSIARYLARYRGPARSARFDLLAWEAGQWRHLPNLWPLPGR
ncbi:MAG TPA: YraN family protein [Bdellovibrionota bacterium]|nr:YraN family protein [Bdellovibrionota bacterium]